MLLAITLIATALFPLQGCSAQDIDPELYDQMIGTCYTSGSICEVRSTLSDVCGENEDWESRYECICETGDLSAREACDACQRQFGRDTLGLVSAVSLSCSSYGFTIAPIPESILSQVSEFNATHPFGGGTSRTDDPSQLTEDSYITSTSDNGGKPPETAVTPTLALDTATLSFPSLLDTPSASPTTDAAGRYEVDMHHMAIALCGYWFYWQS